MFVIVVGHTYGYKFEMKLGYTKLIRRRQAVGCMDIMAFDREVRSFDIVV